MASLLVVFVDHPDSNNAVDGTEVQFSCIAINASLVLFEVNGTSAGGQIVIDKGFIQLWIEYIDGTTQRADLTATTLTQCNNTEVECRTTCIVYGSASQILSDYATLLVQHTRLLSIHYQLIMTICSQVYHHQLLT